MKAEHIPNTLPRTHSPTGRFIGSTILKLMGWQITGAFPGDPKFIAAIAPHTSNWDFIIAIAVKLKLGLKVQFLGKHSIFVGPFGMLLRKLGGLPVDRRASHGVVEQVQDIFSQHPALILALAPEGTRKYMPQWKTGFIYMAQSANVPIVPMLLDYRSKTFCVLEPLTVTTDVDAQLKQVKQLYPKAAAKYPDQVSD